MIVYYNIKNTMVVTFCNLALKIMGANWGKIILLSSCR